MARAVFYSWQSDLSARETRALIREAMVAAIADLTAQFEEADRPEIDHDTRGVAGSPEIVATILAKIDAAAVFVADVTPIAVSEGGKHLPNPNVSIELGYAKKSLTPDRVITVWNTAIAGSKETDLPFDMRHRRGPISFELPVGASKDELRAQREHLTRQLIEAISACLKLVRNEAPALPNWQGSDPKEVSIWSDADKALVVNTGFDGSKRFAMQAAPRGFIRLLPGNWEASENVTRMFGEQSTHLIPLGRYSSLSWGPTRGGFLSYRISAPIEEQGILPTATRWFRDNGELWGIASSFFTEGQDGSMIFSYGYAIENWISWLKHHLRVDQLIGAHGPFSVIAGIDGIDGTVWPHTTWGGNVITEALEARAVHAFSVSGPDDEAIEEGIQQTYNISRQAYGLPPATREEFDAARR